MRGKKKRISSISIKFIVAVGDFILMNLTYVLLYVIHTRNFGIDWESLKFSALLLNLTYFISFIYHRVILDQRSVNSEKIVGLVAKTVSTFAALVLVCFLFLKFKAIPPLYLLLYFVLLFILISSWRLVCREAIKWYRSNGENPRSVIILGAGHVAQLVYEKVINNSIHGYNFYGFFDDRESKEYHVPPELVKGKISDVIDFIKTTEIDEILCALPAERSEDRKALPIMKYAENNMIRFMIIPDFMRFVKRSVSLGALTDSIPVVYLREEPLLKDRNRIIKRSFDVLFSLSFLLTVFPILYIVLGPIIKMTSKGPIFYKQKRTGENGIEFNCLKFRSMEVNKDADKVQATKGDARLTKIGAFMRKTNLDEMPQFINVLVGDMSVVGPRPHMLAHTEMYSRLITNYMVRHYAKPGITGWAQVTGFRGETKGLSQMEGRVEKDVWYIENWSFFLDLRIIYMTIRNMIKGEDNAY